MRRNKVLIIFQSLLFLVGSVSGRSFYVPQLGEYVAFRDCLYRPQLAGGTVAILLDRAGMRHLRSVDFSPIFEEPELLFDTHIPQWVHEKKLLSSAAQKNSFSYVTSYGAYALAALVAGVGMYGGYRFYKNLKTREKGPL